MVNKVVDIISGQVRVLWGKINAALLNGHAAQDFFDYTDQEIAKQTLDEVAGRGSATEHALSVGEGNADQNAATLRQVRFEAAQALNTARHEMAEEIGKQTLDRVASRGSTTEHVLSVGEGSADQNAATLRQVRFEAAQVLGTARTEIAALRGPGAMTHDTLKKASDSIDTLLSIVQSEDADLDTVREIVAFIKNNKDVIDAIATNKLDKSAHNAFVEQMGGELQALTAALAEKAAAAHSHTPAQLGAATAAQGERADSAVQPDSRKLMGPIWEDVGVADAIALTVAGYTEYKEGDFFTFKVAASNSSSTVNININGLGNKRLYAAGTTTPAGPVKTGLYAGGIYTAVYFNDAFWLLGYAYAISGSAGTATYSTYATNGVDSNVSTYLANKVSREGKYLPVATFTKTYTSTYVDGASINSRIQLLEVSRGDGDVELEVIEVSVVISMPAHTGATFVDTPALAKVYVDGRLIGTGAADIALVCTSNSATTRAWTLYVKSNKPDKIFLVNPQNYRGRSFSATSAATSTGVFLSTYVSAGTPLAELPAPVCGEVVEGQLAPRGLYNANNGTTCEVWIGRAAEYDAQQPQGLAFIVE